MIDDNLLRGKRISLLIRNTEKEHDVRVLGGEIIKKEGDYYFINQPEGWKLTLTEEMLSRLKEVPESLKTIMLNADFAISLSMGSLPHEGSEGFEATGIKWE